MWTQALILAYQQVREYDEGEEAKAMMGGGSNSPPPKKRKGRRKR